MLFHIRQVHTPETCPRDEGGSNSLFNPNVPGVKLIGPYGAYDGLHSWERCRGFEDMGEGHVRRRFARPS